MSVTPELMIIQLIFNQQVSVREVMQNSPAEIETWTKSSLVLAIDDGSSDETPSNLERLNAGHGNRSKIPSRENQGHGRNRLEGHRIAAEHDSAFVTPIKPNRQFDPYGAINVFKSTFPNSIRLRLSAFEVISVIPNPQSSRQ